MWKDQKTRKGRCMSLNRPWTGPWKVIKRLGDVVYRIKCVGSSKVGLKRRIVHHNQLKRFYETTELQKETTQSKQTPRLPWPKHTAENKNDVVIVVHGPDTDDKQETQLHQDEVEPAVLEPEGRPYDIEDHRNGLCHMKFIFKL